MKDILYWSVRRSSLMHSQNTLRSAMSRVYLTIRWNRLDDYFATDRQARNLAAVATNNINAVSNIRIAPSNRKFCWQFARATTTPASKHLMLLSLGNLIDLSTLSCSCKSKGNLKITDARLSDETFHQNLRTKDWTFWSTLEDNLHQIKDKI